ncbi:MAG TPA: recombinase family protein [Planctomycetota bacterium]|nr:recombinase family protein [Planctomycetota bacterium]
MSPDPERQRNSIELQRQTVEAFIASRQHEGWLALPEHYDDMGFTGGNMERPALERLLDDAQQGRIDCVVVYKLDRLTRSLVDFARLVDIFDAHGVGFACATQELDTTNPMGRLALNVLLSFAQFERGIIADRIRDKVCARFRRGQWGVGGAPRGYELHRGNPRLVPDDGEAELVRTIFALYLEHRSTIRVAEELNRLGRRTRHRVSAKGNARGGNPFGPCAVAGVLRNVVYIGKVRCNGQTYPGEHEPIVDEELWRRAQPVLDRNAAGATRHLKNMHRFLLKDLLHCQACGSPTEPRTLDAAKGLLYYRCAAAGRPPGTRCPAGWVRSRPLDAAVLKHIREHAAGSSGAAAAMRQAREQSIRHAAELEERRHRLNEELQRLRKPMHQLPEAPPSPRVKSIRAELVSSHRELLDERNLAKALLVFDPGWDSLEPLEQWHALSLLVERVVWDARTERVTVFYQEPGIRALCGRSSEFLAGSPPTNGTRLSSLQRPTGFV